MKTVIAILILLSLEACVAKFEFAPPAGISITVMPILPPYPSATQPGAPK